MNSCLFSPIKLCISPRSVAQRSLLLPQASVHLHSSSSSMASLALPNLWKPHTTAIDRCLVSVVEAAEEEEDSFFELEFTLPDNLDSDAQKIGRIGDFISGEKPDPRAARSKPQSPISILKQSAPKLRVFMFGKPNKRSKPEKSSSPSPEQAHSGDSGSRRKARVNFTVKLRIETAAPSSDGFCRKYLNLFKKPLDVKLPNTNSSSKARKSFDTASFASPRKSESNGRLAVPAKSFGKCRSAGALLVGASLKDDSLTQQNDGIQGAILHCKQSFNSSKERRVMCRSASDTSNEKSFQTTE